MFTAVIQGLVALQSWFGSLSNAALNLQLPLDAARERFEQVEDERFQTEGRGQWAQLRPVTVLKRGGAHPILTESNALRKSFEQGASGNVHIATQTTLEIGTSIPYAVPLDQGFRNFGTVPAQGGLTRPIKMRGQRVVGRELLDDDARLGRDIGIAFENKLFAIMGL